MKVSIVCPYYNEGSIIEKAIQALLDNLKRLPEEYELVLVNDGSTDVSESVVSRLVKGNVKVKTLSYRLNEGRGYALKHGIEAATGDIIITTEIDLSWGDDIILKILQKFQAEPNLEVVIASPNLPGGGYKNVPRNRVWISRIGNLLLRVFFTKKITMNTGMTRGYRRHAIQGLPTSEKGKEFHVEVLLKLQSLGYRIGEVPAVIEWRNKDFTGIADSPRRSSSRISKLIFSHLNYVVFANPIRYFWAIAVFFMVAGTIFLGLAVYHFLIGDVVVYSMIIALLSVILALLFFGFGIVSHQNNFILKEIWRLQKLDAGKNSRREN